MKVAILALDGLEYNLVERFRLKNMKQGQYGKLSIPKECYAETVDPRGEKVYEPYTPYVWSAFLTGKLPTESVDQKNFVKWDSSALQFLRVLSMKMRLSAIKNKGKIFKKLGFERTSFSIEDYKCPTIFSYAKKPCVINVPTVSKEWHITLQGKNFTEMLQLSWRRFYEIKNKALEVLKEGNWNLFMSYTKLLDTVGELCFGNFKELFKAYSVCNQLVGEIKELLSSDTLCLVISDHGMERFGKTRFGKHSDHAFYSLNILTDWKPETVLDFHNQIKIWLTQ